MTLKTLAAVALGAALLSVGAVSPAAAQGSEQVELQSMYMLFQTGCEGGVQDMCQAMNSVQERGNYMQMAGMACQQQGNQEACQVYQALAYDTHATYEQIGQQLQAAGYGGGGGGYEGGGAGGYVDPLGQNHEQRMQAIQGFGAQNTQNFNARMQAMDRSHEQFMSTLR